MCVFLLALFRWQDCCCFLRCGGGAAQLPFISFKPTCIIIFFYLASSACLYVIFFVEAASRSDGLFPSLSLKSLCQAVCHNHRKVEAIARQDSIWILHTHHFSLSGLSFWSQIALS